MNLVGKHIIVTGASSGIGRATCIQAAELGARVSMIARNRTELEKTLEEMKEGNHSFFIGDLSDCGIIDQLMDEIVSLNGLADGFVHCAGSTISLPLRATKSESLYEMLGIHLVAFAECVRSLSGKRRSNNGASFVGVSSVAAKSGYKAQGAYAAAKAAMDSIVHPYARELAARRIRINTIEFGMVDTPMYHRDFLDIGGDDERLNKDQVLGIIPPYYASRAICFVLSDDAKYMTGTNMVYDAGSLL